MIGMIIGAGINLILDPIFIIPLDMGVAGAAWATVIAQIISSIYFLSYYFRGKSYLKIHTRNLIIRWGIMKDILAIGISAFSMVMAGTFASVLVNRTVVAFGGDIAIGAFGILHRIMMFALMPGMVIGQGLQPILGFNYGAKRFDRALKTIRIATIWASVFSIIAFFVLFFFPEPFLRIFTSDGALVEVSVYAGRRVFFVLPVIGFMMVGTIIFQAIGKVIHSIVTSLARSVLFLLPLILILPNYWQIDGVWLSFPIADILTFFLTLGLLIPLLIDFNRKSREQYYNGSSPPSDMPRSSEKILVKR
jgi:Na+-driven multidrug efflux pump